MSNDAALQRGPIPPPTLSTLLTTLGTQTLLMLGQIEHPITKRKEVDVEQARHFIDLLSMLEEKTAGNRNADESHLLERLLSDLRMMYVQVKK